MPTLEFSLNLSPEEVIRYYRGEVRTAMATLDDGRTVQFPASALSRVVTEHGVHGRFQLIIDENQKFVDLQRLRVRK
jgi:hypothetical protein